MTLPLRTRPPSWQVHLHSMGPSDYSSHPKDDVRNCRGMLTALPRLHMLLTKSLPKSWMHSVALARSWHQGPGWTHVGKIVACLFCASAVHGPHDEVQLQALFCSSSSVFAIMLCCSHWLCMDVKHKIGKPGLIEMKRLSLQVLYPLVSLRRP